MNTKLEIKFAPVNELNSWNQPITMTPESRARENAPGLKSRRGSNARAASYRERLTQRRLFTLMHAVDRLTPVAALSA